MAQAHAANSKEVVKHSVEAAEQPVHLKTSTGCSEHVIVMLKLLINVNLSINVELACVIPRAGTYTKHTLL